MHVLIVHAHPEPQSFNGALTRTAVETLTAAGHEVAVSDLYAMDWEARSNRHNFTTVHDADFLKLQLEEAHATRQDGFAADIKTELEKLVRADVLIFQFPLWWFGLPAILKGWVDRVFAMGAVYGSGDWYDRGRFRGKRAMLSLTVGATANMYAEGGLHGEMSQLLYPIHHGILRFTGFDVLPPVVAWAPARVDAATREGYLEAYRTHLGALNDTTPIAFPSLDDYDPETFAPRIKVPA